MARELSTYVRALQRGLEGVLVLVKLRERGRDGTVPGNLHVFIWLKGRWLSKNELIKQQSKMVVRVESVNSEWKRNRGMRSQKERRGMQRPQKV